MRYLALAFCIATIGPRLALGGEPAEPSSGQGYVFAAPGAAVDGTGAVAMIQFGGGADGNVYKGLGVGAELGFLGPMEYLGQGVGLLSVNGLYTFKTRNPRLAPFVTGGYSLAFRVGVANGLNFGAGTHYWFSRRVGLRVEVRDYISPSYLEAHLLQARIGLAFR
jgi:hypothetical protein